MHENLYESNRNYGELCTNTDMKAIEIMANYPTKTYIKAIETMMNYARRPIWKQSKLW